MPQFTWTGRDARQDVRTGIIEAASAREAALALSSMDVQPEVILPFPPQPAPAGQRAAWLQRRRRVRPADVQEMAVQARALLRSGVAKERIFTVLSSSATHPELAEALQRMGAQVQEGTPLWEAMADHPQIFDAFGIALLRQAEADDRAADGFRHLELHQDFTSTMRARIVDAGSRPVELAVMLAAALALGLLGLVPAARASFLAGTPQLPWLTQGLLDASQSLTAWAPWLLLWAGALSGVGLVLRFVPGPFAGLRRRWDGLRLREPLSGPAMRLAATAQLAGCLALGQRAGLPLAQNLELAARLQDNEQLRASTQVLEALVRQGASLGDAFGVESWLGAQTRQRLHDAQAAGQLGEALADLTRVYRGLAETAWERLDRRYRLAMAAGTAAIALPVALGLLLPLFG